MGDVTVRLSFEQAGALILYLDEIGVQMDRDTVDATRALRVAWAKAAQRRAGVR
jgi:hypothetical protein